MKGILCIVFSVLFSIQFTYGQVNDSKATDNKNSTHDDYYLKHKKQQKLGWILFGAGLGTTITGIIIAAPHAGASEGSSTQGSAGAGLALLGISASLVSIPFLISSGSNKRKARDYLAFETAKPDPEYYNEFHLKHLKQRKVGRILLGSGLALGISGFILTASTQNSEGSVNVADIGGVMIAFGAIASITSLPFLISSSSNKRKARAFMSAENIGSIDIPNFNNNYISLGLLIDI